MNPVLINLPKNGLLAFALITLGSQNIVGMILPEPRKSEQGAQAT